MTQGQLLLLTVFVMGVLCGWVGCWVWDWWSYTREDRRLRRMQQANQNEDKPF